MFDGWFQKVIGKNKSKDVAKRRLQFALVYDKLEVSDDTLENLQNDMIEVISRYFIIDKDTLKLDINHAEDTSALMVNIPILSTKRRTQRS